MAKFKSYIYWGLLLVGETCASFVTTARMNLTAASCTDTAQNCNNWPSASDGQVVLFESTETFKGASHRRAFRAYLPSRVTSGTKPVPLLVFLHGGFGCGETEMLTKPFSKLADGRGARWRPNTAFCKYQYPAGYRKADGTACLSPSKDISTEGFVAIFPDGLPDRGTPNDRESKSKGHWEDGRTPSPGWYQEGVSTTAQEYRDDVGFLDYIITLALAELTLPSGAALVDPTRVYVVGTSNGGMMTHRITCHVGDPAFPSLAHIAAVSFSVATMPEPLFDGSSGREKCNPRLPLSVQYIVGNNLDTPNCSTSYPCDSPLIDGDTIMPYLSAGQRATVYSPDQGRVVAHIDAKSLFIKSNEGLLGVSATNQVMPVGYFCTLTNTTFPGSNAVVQSYVTDGGNHMVGGSLMDISPYSSIPEFLFQFQRSVAPTATPTQAPNTQPPSLTQTPTSAPTQLGIAPARDSYSLRLILSAALLSLAFC